MNNVQKTALFLKDGFPKYDYPCFTFMLTEEGPELLGEEDLTTELMEIFEERGLIEMAQRIKLREDQRLFIEVQET